MAERRKAWRKRKIAAGLCGHCGSRPLKTTTACDYCAAERTRRERERKKHPRPKPVLDIDNRTRPRVDGNYIYLW